MFSNLAVQFVLPLIKCIEWSPSLHAVEVDPAVVVVGRRARGSSPEVLDNPE